MCLPGRLLRVALRVKLNESQSLSSGPRGRAALSSRYTSATLARGWCYVPRAGSRAGDLGVVSLAERQAEQGACRAGLGVGSGCAARQRRGHFPVGRQRRRGAVGECFGADVLDGRNRVGAVGFGALDRERGGASSGASGGSAGAEQAAGAADALATAPGLASPAGTRGGAAPQRRAAAATHGSGSDAAAGSAAGDGASGSAGSGEAGGTGSPGGGTAGGSQGGAGQDGSGQGGQEASRSPARTGRRRSRCWRRRPRSGQGAQGGVVGVAPQRRRPGPRPDRRDGPGGGQPPAVPGHGGHLRRELLQPAVVGPGAPGINRGQRSARPAYG